MMLAAGAVLALVAWPLVYWGSLYDKLWLQPLALIVFLLAVCFAVQRENSGSGWLLEIVATIFLIVEASTNMVGLVRDHFTETQGIQQASQVAATIRPQDAVVVDFDDISSLYYALWGMRGNALVLPASTPADAASWMKTALENCRHSGGSLYFLGILDQSETLWNQFLAKRVGISYESFAEYRARAQVVETFHLRNNVLTLRRLKVD